MTTTSELTEAPPARLDVAVVRTLDQQIGFRADSDADDAEAGPGTMTGIFSTFNQWYEINSWFEGHFIERIAPGAFKRTIQNRSDQSPVRVLLEHGFDPVVGDKPLGVPEVLKERSDGAYAEVPLFDTSYNRDLAPALRGGAYGQSFRFQVLSDDFVEPEAESWEDPRVDAWRDLPQRTITEVRLIEFGPTVFPANPGTSVGMRSTTDEFYEQLRRRDEGRYDDVLRSVRSARIPAPWYDRGASYSNSSSTSVGTATMTVRIKPEISVGDAPTDPAEDSPTRHSADPPDAGHSADPPDRHSDAPSPTDPSENRSNSMDELQTVEERAARQSEIRVRLSEIDTEYAGAELPAEVRAEWDQLDAEYNAHQRAIEDSQRRAERIRALAADPANVESGNAPRPVPNVRRSPDDIYDLTAARQRARSVDEVPQMYRDNARRAIEVGRFPGATDRSKAQETAMRMLENVDDEKATLARRILVTGSPTYDRAFGKMATALSTNGLTAEEQRALSLGVGSEGGFAVPYQLDPTIIDTGDGVVSPIRRISRVESIVGKEWQGVTSSGITVSRASEGDEAGDDAPSLGDPSVKPQRVQGFVPFSIEIDQDWTALRSEMSRMLNDAKAEEEGTSFVTGDGTDPNPQGVVTGVKAVSGSVVDGAAEGALAVDDIYELDNQLPPKARPNARYLAAKPIYNATRQLDTSGGANLWVQLGAGLPSTLNGYPAEEASEMDTVDTTAGATSFVLLLGDFSRFLIVDRIGMSVELVPHLFGSNGRPTGKRGLYAIWRNSSKVLDANRFRILKITASTT